MNNITTVLLDIDGTIMNFLKGQRNAFCTSCETHGIPYTEETYLTFDQINKKYWKLFERGLVKKEELIYARFAELFDVFNIDFDPHDFEPTYQKLLGEQCFFIDGALDAVKYLKTKYDIYIVTNGVRRTQYNRLNKSGLIKYADKVFISEEVGYQKPQKEYFDKALEGVDRAAAVIIGDSMTSDIKGGIDAGIKTIWYNDLHDTPTYTPDVEISSWQEIYSIL